MINTPKSLRLQIGIFGRTNVGKSSFLNMISGQEVAITSNVAGTTTDVVEKVMELLPVGPVVFLDTAGIDDKSELAEKRIEKTEKVFHRADVSVLLTEPDIWDDYEESIVEKAKEHNTPLIIAVNKTDISNVSNNFKSLIKNKSKFHLFCSSIEKNNREEYLSAFKEQLISTVPEEFLKPAPLIGDLVQPGNTAVFIVPIDLQAPKGRLILPQVQSIRDILDSDAAVLVVKEREFRFLLENFKNPPELIVCDSQVVQKMVADTPDNIKCTTFSTLFARYKGDLIEEAKGVCAIDGLKNGDKVLIAEACSHHAMEDDIGKVKIPRWLKQYIGLDIEIEVFSGRDYPKNLTDYKLIIHCGACMLNRREMLYRIEKAKEAGVPVTNYGICISFVQGVLKRILSPFPAALDAYEREIERIRKIK